MDFPAVSGRRRRAIAAGAIVLVLGVPLPARAAVTCSFASATLQITLGAPQDLASVVRETDDIVVREGTEEIPCGGPTVDNTDTIRVNDPTSGTTAFTIDLSGGPFEPGLTDEGDLTSEIEFAVDLFAGFPDRLTIVGSGAGDDIVFQSGGINLNRGSEPLFSEDVDVTTAGTEEHAVESGSGADVVTGTPGVGGVFAGKLILDGGDDADDLTGGSAADELSGGDGNDDLFGSDSADDLHGNAGDDELFGDDGDDELFGGGEADTLEGGEGADTLDGGGSDDAEMGEDGDDVFDQGTTSNGGDDLDGGTGFDLVAFDLRSGPLEVTVGTGANDGESGEGDDVGGDVEGVLGGSGGDLITGDVQDNVLRGGPGNDDLDGDDGDDVVDGDAGSDDLDGGLDEDTASFFGAPAVTASLATGAASGDGNDTLSGFENVEGGAYGDTLAGDGGKNILTGRGGGDSLSGGSDDDELHGGDGNDTVAGEAGNDLFKGNGGVDTAAFTGSAAPVSVNIGAGTATGEGSDSLVGIENASGGPAGDSLVGTDQGNALIGNGGKDTILGFDGDDDLRGSEGDDTVDGGAGDDTIAGGDGHDVMTGASGSDRFLEGEQKGPNGADSIAGGPGRDLVTYGGRKNRVRVSIGSSAGDGQRGEGDRVEGDVERARGTTRRDVLLGNGAKNTLYGGAGDDTLQGRGGRDRLVGGGGDDRLDGGPQPDICKGGGGKNVLKDCGGKRPR